MARPKKNPSKAEVKEMVANLKTARKEAIKALAPFQEAAKAADKALATAKKDTAKQLAAAEGVASKAKAKLEKAMEAHTKGLAKIDAKLAELTTAEA